MQTHQSPKTAQLWLLEIIEFPVETNSVAASSHLPLVARVLMQCKSVVMQLEAIKGKTHECGVLSASERQMSKYGKITYFI
jgi:hypothetical protein